MLASGRRLMGKMRCTWNAFQSFRSFTSIQSGQTHPSGPVNPVVFGQPIPLSHPHLLQPGMVNPGVYKEELVLRRHRLAEKIRSSAAAQKSPHQTSVMSGHAHIPAHLVVIPAGQKQFMVDKIPFPFRQDTDFRYLTGCLEPDCVLVMEVRKDSEKSFLFFRDSSRVEEKWEGPRSKPDPASNAFFGVDQTYSASDLRSFVQSFRKESEEFLIWYDYLNPKNQDVHSVLMELIQNLQGHQSIETPKTLIHELRVIKSPAEIALMRETCRIASNAIEDTISKSSKLTTEGQIQAFVEYKCKFHGAQLMAYPSVVAFGNNANIIHYSGSSQALKDGELLLLDAGCDFHGYSSDITRTWPIGGKYSPHQKILYEIVLDVQRRLINLASEHQENKISIDGLYNNMLSFLREHLVAEGLIPSDFTTEAQLAKCREFCPHHISHYLGMDVHDTTLVSRSNPLLTNMVITVEPGIYIPETNTDVPEEFRGIGIRIEDDVLISKHGCEVLTQQCPRDVQELENLCQKL